MSLKRMMVSMVAGILVAGGALAADELPYIAPARVGPVPYVVQTLPGGAFSLTLKDAIYVVTSEYSLIPGWAKLDTEKASGFVKVGVEKDSVTAETDTYSLSRKIIRRDECVEISDTLVNKTDENLPVMVRHNCKIKDVTDYRMSGRKIYMSRSMSSDTENPTVVCTTAAGSVGILPLDDVFATHCLDFSGGGNYGIADNNFVLKPKASYSLRFALFPTEAKDYYSVINAMRRFLNVNFAIDGCSAGCGPRQAGAKNWQGLELPNRATSVEYMRNWLTCKDAKYVIAHRVETIDGKGLNGPDWLKVADAQLYKDFFAKLKQAVPGTLTTVYFANNFYALEDGKAKYDGCQILNPDGTQADYRDPKYPLWLSIDGNAYAKDLEKTMDFILDTIGTDGVYWDEFERSAAMWHYGEPWDGVSADIDPQTHKITRLKSSCTLLTQPWRLKMVQRILARKLFLIINGAPSTETMRKLHFVSFTETGGIANCLKTHLYTPLALGDHITEKTEQDCYRWMLEALNYGCLYYWYHDQVLPITHPTLTSYMFPTTPVELGQGYLIGKERILTAKSGWFSFGDKAEADAHFFNADGVEVKREAEKAQKDGKTYFKVELAEHESCALVKK